MPQQRRVPTQKRSKEKYDAIIASAKTLIGEHGNDAVSMREIAKHANIAISSVYQYFPDKNAILSALMENYFWGIQDMLQSVIAPCKTCEELADRLCDGMEMFFQSFEQDPALATLWASVQANTVLRELDLQDSKENAHTICEKIVSIIPDVNQDKTYDATLLMLNTGGMVVRLALSMENEEKRRTLDAYRSQIKLTLRAIEQNGF